MARAGVGGVSSRIEQATVALVDLLTAVGTFTVTQNEDVPVNFVTETTPVVNIEDGDDATEPHFIASNTVEFITQLTVSGYVTTNDAAALGQARDALWLAVWNVVLANPRLVNGSDELTWNVLPGSTTRRLASEPGKPVAVFEVPVLLHIKAQADDPAVAA